MQFRLTAYGIKNRKDVIHLALHGHTSPTLIHWEIVIAGLQNASEKTNVFLHLLAQCSRISLSTADHLTLLITAALNPIRMTMRMKIHADILAWAIRLSLSSALSTALILISGALKKCK